MTDKMCLELETADGFSYRIVKQSDRITGVVYEDSDYIVEVCSCPEFRPKGLSKGEIFLQGRNTDSDGENLFISDKRAFVSLNKAVKLKVRLDV